MSALSPKTIEEALKRAEPKEINIGSKEMNEEERRKNNMGLYRKSQ